jgi:putative transposase
MDWYSRFVLSWELSNTMETDFCLAALEAALRFGQPEIWNSDQGAQFTAADFLAPLKKRGVRISMDGRGRALDKAYASHCTSFAHVATTRLAGTLFENLTP